MGLYLGDRHAVSRVLGVAQQNMALFSGAPISSRTDAPDARRRASVVVSDGTLRHLFNHV